MKMQSKFSIIIYIISLLLISCSTDDDDSSKDNYLIGQTYAHSIFPSEQECLDYQEEEGIFVNCFQLLSFQSDREGTIVLTDIVNTFNYTRQQNQLIVEASTTTEFEKDLFFTIVNDTTLQKKDDRSLWILE